MPDLVLAVKEKWFKQIKSGTKTEEYRLYHDYWIKRLLGKTFDRVVITWGYPKKTDQERRLYFKWVGHPIKNIKYHDAFGNKPKTKVFAIDLTRPIKGEKEC